MKTAVEWLAEQMQHPQIFNPYFEQAKEMEKQQLIDALKEDTFYYMDSEDYYNQTFNK